MVVKVARLGNGELRAVARSWNPRKSSQGERWFTSPRSGGVKGGKGDRQITRMGEREKIKRKRKRKSF